MTESVGQPTRPIDQRVKPPVAGIDLAQALNYLDIAQVGESFVYDDYTSSRLAYVRGRRPKLEAIATSVAANCSTELAKVQALATFAAKDVLWAGFHCKHTGKQLAKDRALTEEQIIDSGYGWCNEQARVLCCLTQILGLPSRLVFAGNNARRYGHVVVETLLKSGWLMIDQSFGYCFLMDGQPVRACDVYRDSRARSYFEPIYKTLADDFIDQLGFEILTGEFDMMLADNPLDGFKDLGYHNHFVI